VLEQVLVQRWAKGGRRLVVYDRVPADGRDACGGHLLGDRDAAAAVEDDELEKGGGRERGEHLEHRLGQYGDERAVGGGEAQGELLVERVLGVGMSNIVQDAWLVALEKLSQFGRVAVVLHDGPRPVGCEALLHGVGLGVGAWEWGALRVADKDECVDLVVVHCCCVAACGRSRLCS
jgi:hypothetical protein